MSNVSTVYSYLKQVPTSFYRDGDDWVYENDLIVDDSGNKILVRIPVGDLQRVVDITVNSNLNPAENALEEAGRAIGEYVFSQLQNINVPTLSGVAKDNSVSVYPTENSLALEIEYGFQEAFDFSYYNLCNCFSYCCCISAITSNSR